MMLYIPVPHKGYFQFFERYSSVAGTLYLIGEDLAAEFSTLHIEIRALDPYRVKKMLSALKLFRYINVLTIQNIGTFKPPKLITASEVVSRGIVQKYLPDTEVIYDTVFLRYDEDGVKSLKPVRYDRESSDPFDKEMMMLAYNESEGSSCWWRHVGAVLVKSGEVLVKAHNQHVPSEQTPYIIGDPRDFIEAGKLSHFSSSLHGEKMILLKALSEGINMSGADIYVSVFPCPDCAKLIAYSGIKRCFFGSGHASLDGQEVLKSRKVELIYVPID